ncbi:MAG: cell wall-binding repeat-containing protein [Acidimicrobiales bacterium]
MPADFADPPCRTFDSGGYAHFNKSVGRLHPRGLYVIGDTGSVSDKLVNDIKAAGIITAAPPAPPTTLAPSTTAPATPTTAPAATTTTTIATSTATRSDVIRLSAGTAAELARSVADAMDVRTTEEKSRAVPGFQGAVVVNPDSAEAPTAIAYAAMLRYPILYAGRDDLPAPTADAFNAFAIKNAFVVGGTGSVSDSVMGRLPTPKRLPGRTTSSGTSRPGARP